MRELFAKEYETEEVEREACFNAIVPPPVAPVKPARAAASASGGSSEDRVTTPKRRVKVD